MSKIGILFDIDKLDSVLYGSRAWEVFWRVIGADTLGENVRLFEGDTAATLNGDESVYCLAIQACDQEIAAIKARLEASDEYRAVAAKKRFLKERALESEPLPEVGRIRNGQIVGPNAVNPRSTRAKLKREESDEPYWDPDYQAPDRTRPASSRSVDLPKFSTLEELCQILAKRFPDSRMENKRSQLPPDEVEYWSRRFTLTPEELCDVVEAYPDLIDVYWNLTEANVAEHAVFVTFFPKGAKDQQFDFFGMLEFPSRSDAKDYCGRESISPTDWGLDGRVADNFTGTDYVQSVDEEFYDDYYRQQLIEADSLWSRICFRRDQLGRNRPSAGVLEPTSSEAVSGERFDSFEQQEQAMKQPQVEVEPEPQRREGSKKWWQFWR